ncbi:MAG: hypothetical protein V1882_07075 [Candidatus Omnitrophota bacterium]
MKIGLKVVAAVTLLCFVTTQCISAAPGVGIEIANPREVPSYLSLDVPAELGTVDSLYEAPASANPQFVLHIQNAHANYEAQMKIKQLLAHMDKRYGFKTIFVEGASEKLDADYMRLFPDEARNLKLCDGLAKQGELTGAELYLIEQTGARGTGNGERKASNGDRSSLSEFRGEAVEAFGIEEAALYRSNYNALKKVFGAETDIDHFFKGFDGKIDHVSSKVFTPETRELIADWKRFEQGRRAFMPFVQALVQKSKKVLKVDLESLFAQAGWPQITRLLVIQRMEKDLDRTQALKEKTTLLEMLRQKGASKELVATLENFNEGNITVGKSTKEVLPRVVLERLASEMGPKGFKFSDYPSFSLFAGYVALKAELDPKVLFAEIESLFTQMLDALGKEPEQKSLLALYRDGELVRKLLHLELTRAEWRQVVADKDRLTIPSLVSRLKECVQVADDGGRKAEGVKNGSAPSSIQHPISKSPVSGLQSVTDVMPEKFAKTMEELFSTGLEFYDVARQREAVFYKEMQNAMKERKISKAILITGGFHTDGMSDLFRDHDMSYGIVTPRLSEKSDENLYRKIMLQKNTGTFEISYLESILRMEPLAAQLEQGGGDVTNIVQEFMAVANISDPDQAVAMLRATAEATGKTFLNGKDGKGFDIVKVGSGYRLVLREQNAAPVTTQIGSVKVETGSIESLMAPAIPADQPEVEVRSATRSELRLGFKSVLWTLTILTIGVSLVAFYLQSENQRLRVQLGVETQKLERNLDSHVGKLAQKHGLFDQHADFWVDDNGMPKYGIYFFPKGVVSDWQAEVKSGRTTVYQLTQRFNAYQVVRNLADELKCPVRTEAELQKFVEILLAKGEAGLKAAMKEEAKKWSDKILPVAGPFVKFRSEVRDRDIATIRSGRISWDLRGLSLSLVFWGGLALSLSFSAILMWAIWQGDAEIQPEPSATPPAITSSVRSEMRQDLIVPQTGTAVSPRVAAIDAKRARWRAERESQKLEILAEEAKSEFPLIIKWRMDGGNAALGEKPPRGVRTARTPPGQIDSIQDGRVFFSNGLSIPVASILDLRTADPVLNFSANVIVWGSAAFLGLIIVSLIFAVFNVTSYLQSQNRDIDARLGVQVASLEKNRQENVHLKILKLALGDDDGDSLFNKHADFWIDGDIPNYGIHFFTMRDISDWQKQVETGKITLDELKQRLEAYGVVRQLADELICPVPTLEKLDEFVGIYLSEGMDKLKAVMQEEAVQRSRDVLLTNSFLDSLTRSEVRSDTGKAAFTLRWLQVFLLGAFIFTLGAYFVELWLELRQAENVRKTVTSEHVTAATEFTQLFQDLSGLDSKNSESTQKAFEGLVKKYGLKDILVGTSSSSSLKLLRLIAGGYPKQDPGQPFTGMIFGSEGGKRLVLVGPAQAGKQAIIRYKPKWVGQSGNALWGGVDYEAEKWNLELSTGFSSNDCFLKFGSPEEVAGVLREAEATLPLSSVEYLMNAPLSAPAIQSSRSEVRVGEVVKEYVLLALSVVFFAGVGFLVLSNPLVVNFLYAALKLPISAPAFGIVMKVLGVLSGGALGRMVALRKMSQHVNGEALKAVRKVAGEYGLLSGMQFSESLGENDVQLFLVQGLSEQELRKKFEAIQTIRDLAEETQYPGIKANQKMMVEALRAWARKLLSEGEDKVPEVKERIRNYFTYLRGQQLLAAARVNGSAPAEEKSAPASDASEGKRSEMRDRGPANWFKGVSSKVLLVAMFVLFTFGQLFPPALVSPSFAEGLKETIEQRLADPDLAPGLRAFYEKQYVELETKKTLPETSDKGGAPSKSAGDNGPRAKDPKGVSFYRSQPAVVTTIVDAVSRIGGKYMRPGVGMHSPTYGPMDHVQVHPVTGKPVGNPANYGAPSKEGAFYPAMVHFMEGNPVLKGSGIEQVYSVKDLAAGLHVMQKFQMSGEGTQTYAGLFPWHSKNDNGELLIAEYGGRFMVPTLDNGQMAFGLAADVGATLKATAGTPEKDVHETALKILRGMNFGKYVLSDGSLAAEYNFGTRSLEGKSGHMMLWTEWAIPALWGYLTGQVPEKAWLSFPSPTFVWNSPAGPLDLPEGFIDSVHEWWILQYLHKTIMKSELAPLLRNFFYYHATHALKHDMPGFVATEYWQGGYTQGGIWSERPAGSPAASVGTNPKHEDMATPYATAFLALVAPEPGAAWLSYLFKQKDMVSEYGPQTAFRRAGGPSWMMSADNTFGTLNAAGELYLLLNKQPGGVNDAILKTLEKYYGVSEAQVIEAFNQHAREIKKRLGRDFKAIEAARLPGPPTPGNFSYTPTEKKIFKVQDLSLADQLIDVWHTKNNKTDWDAHTQTLTVRFDFSKSLDRYMYTGRMIKAVPIDGLNYVSLWIPADYKGGTWQIELKDAGVELAPRLNVSSVREGRLSPDKKWREVVFKTDWKASYRGIGAELNYIAFSANDTSWHGTQGEIVFKGMQFHKKDPGTGESISAPATTGARLGTAPEVTGKTSVKQSVPLAEISLNVQTFQKAQKAGINDVAKFLRAYFLQKYKYELSDTGNVNGWVMGIAGWYTNSADHGGDLSNRSFSEFEGEMARKIEEARAKNYGQARSEVRSASFYAGVIGLVMMITTTVAQGADSRQFLEERLKDPTLPAATRQVLEQEYTRLLEQAPAKSNAPATEISINAQTFQKAQKAGINDVAIFLRAYFLQKYKYELSDTGNVNGWVMGIAGWYTNSADHGGDLSNRSFSEFEGEMARKIEETRSKNYGQSKSGSAPAASIAPKPSATPSQARDLNGAKAAITTDLQSKGFAIQDQSWLSGIAPFYTGNRPLEDLQGELTPQKLDRLVRDGMIRPLSSQTPSAVQQPAAVAPTSFFSASLASRNIIASKLFGLHPESQGDRGTVEVTSEGIAATLSYGGWAGLRFPLQRIGDLIPAGTQYLMVEMHTAPHGFFSHGKYGYPEGAYFEFKRDSAYVVGGGKLETAAGYHAEYADGARVTRYFIPVKTFDPQSSMNFFGISTHGFHGNTGMRVEVPAIVPLTGDEYKKIMAEEIETSFIGSGTSKVTIAKGSTGRSEVRAGSLRWPVDGDQNSAWAHLSEEEYLSWGSKLFSGLRRLQLNPLEIGWLKTTGFPSAVKRIAIGQLHSYSVPYGMKLSVDYRNAATGAWGTFVFEQPGEDQWVALPTKAETVVQVPDKKSIPALVRQVLLWRKTMIEQFAAARGDAAQGIVYSDGRRFAQIRDLSLAQELLAQGILAFYDNRLVLVGVTPDDFADRGGVQVIRSEMRKPLKQARLGLWQKVPRTRNGKVVQEFWWLDAARKWLPLTLGVLAFVSVGFVTLKYYVDVQEQQHYAVTVPVNQQIAEALEIPYADSPLFDKLHSLFPEALPELKAKGVISKDEEESYNVVEFAKYVKDFSEENPDKLSDSLALKILDLSAWIAQLPRSEIRSTNRSEMRGQGGLERLRSIQRSVANWYKRWTKSVVSLDRTWRNPEVVSYEPAWYAPAREFGKSMRRLALGVALIGPLAFFVMFPAVQYGLDAVGTYIANVEEELRQAEEINQMLEKELNIPPSNPELSSSFLSLYMQWLVEVEENYNFHENETLYGFLVFLSGLGNEKIFKQTKDAGYSDGFLGRARLLWLQLADSKGKAILEGLARKAELESYVGQKVNVWYLSDGREATWRLGTRPADADLVVGTLIQISTNEIVVLKADETLQVIPNRSLFDVKPVSPDGLLKMVASRSEMRLTSGAISRMQERVEKGLDRWLQAQSHLENPAPEVRRQLQQQAFAHFGFSWQGILNRGLNDPESQELKPEMLRSGDVLFARSRESKQNAVLVVQNIENDGKGQFVKWTLGGKKDGAYLHDQEFFEGALSDFLVKDVYRLNRVVRDIISGIVGPGSPHILLQNVLVETILGTGNLEAMISLVEKRGGQERVTELAKLSASAEKTNEGGEVLTLDSLSKSLDKQVEELFGLQAIKQRNSLIERQDKDREYKDKVLRSEGAERDRSYDVLQNTSDDIGASLVKLQEFIGNLSAENLRVEFEVLKGDRSVEIVRDLQEIFSILSTMRGIVAGVPKEIKKMDQLNQKRGTSALKPVVSNLEGLQAELSAFGKVLSRALAGLQAFDPDVEQLTPTTLEQIEAALKAVGEIDAVLKALGPNLLEWRVKGVAFNGTMSVLEYELRKVLLASSRSEMRAEVVEGQDVKATIERRIQNASQNLLFGDLIPANAPLISALKVAKFNDWNSVSTHVNNAIVKLEPFRNSTNMTIRNSARAASRDLQEALPLIDQMRSEARGNAVMTDDEVMNALQGLTDRVAALTTPEFTAKYFNDPKGDANVNRFTQNLKAAELSLRFALLRLDKGELVDEVVRAHGPETPLYLAMKNLTAASVGVSRSFGRVAYRFSEARKNGRVVGSLGYTGSLVEGLTRKTGLRPDAQLMEEYFVTTEGLKDEILAVKNSVRSEVRANLVGDPMHIASFYYAIDPAKDLAEQKSETEAFRQALLQGLEATQNDARQSGRSADSFEVELFTSVITENVPQTDEQFLSYLRSALDFIYQYNGTYELILLNKSLRDIFESATEYEDAALANEHLTNIENIWALQHSVYVASAVRFVADYERKRGSTSRSEVRTPEDDIRGYIASALEDLETVVYLKYQQKVSELKWGPLASAQKAAKAGDWNSVTKYAKEASDILLGVANDMSANVNARGAAVLVRRDLVQAQRVIARMSHPAEGRAGGAERATLLDDSVASEILMRINNAALNLKDASLEPYKQVQLDPAVRAAKEKKWGRLVVFAEWATGQLQSLAPGNEQVKFAQEDLQDVISLIDPDRSGSSQQLSVKSAIAAVEAVQRSLPSKLEPLAGVGEDAGAKNGDVSLKALDLTEIKGAAVGGIGTDIDDVEASIRFLAEKLDRLREVKGYRPSNVESAVKALRAIANDLRATPRSEVRGGLANDIHELMNIWNDFGGYDFFPAGLPLPEDFLKAYRNVLGQLRSLDGVLRDEAEHAGFLNLLDETIESLQMQTKGVRDSSSRLAMNAPISGFQEIRKKTGTGYSFAMLLNDFQKNLSVLAMNGQGQPNVERELREIEARAFLRIKPLMQLYLDEADKVLVRIQSNESLKAVLGSYSETIHAKLQTIRGRSETRVAGKELESADVVMSHQKLAKEVWGSLSLIAQGKLRSMGFEIGNGSLADVLGQIIVPAEMGSITAEQVKAMLMSLIALRAGQLDQEKFLGLAKTILKNPMMSVSNEAGVAIIITPRLTETAKEDIRQQLIMNTGQVVQVVVTEAMDSETVRAWRDEIEWDYDINGQYISGRFSIWNAPKNVSRDVQIGISSIVHSRKEFSGGKHLSILIENLPGFQLSNTLGTVLESPSAKAENAGVRSLLAMRVSQTSVDQTNRLLSAQVGGVVLKQAPGAGQMNAPYQIDENLLTGLAKIWAELMGIRATSIAA